MPETPSDTARTLNRGTRRKHAKIRVVAEVPFGEDLHIHHYRLGNGLDVLSMVDRAAPVVSYQTWFGVGSRNEARGKTGLAHLFEHLMFKATEAQPQGAFDRLMEEAGADTNAATWTDWTCYYENLPRRELELAVRLEADRLENLVLNEEQVSAEKDVVMNERRYTVDDDVEGSTHERLWAEAFRSHPYRWPTIGWMRDIEGFTVRDCVDFYRTWYAPNNATVVVVGDVDERDSLGMVQRYYGHLSPSRLPRPPRVVEPAQRKERRVDHPQPTDTEKVNVGWRAPAFGTTDYLVLTMASDMLTGGRSSRLYRDLVATSEIASEVSGSLSPFREPGLYSLWADAREGRRADELLDAIDDAIDRLARKPPTEDELEKTKNRLELGFVSGMETAGGKADQIGFCASVLDDPGAVFARLEAYRRVTAEQVSAAVRRHLVPRARTVVTVLPNGAS